LSGLNTHSFVHARHEVTLLRGKRSVGTTGSTDL
jgi:hypothetical protein